MSSNTSTYTIHLTGNTYQWKDKIKEQGWKWNSLRKSWTKVVDAATVDAALAAGGEAPLEFMRSIRGSFKGCIAHANNGRWDKEVWASPTYVRPVGHEVDGADMAHFDD